MKKSRFSEEQMVKILREADRTPIAEVAKKHGVSEQTIYVWRRRFGKMEVADTKKLKALEAENTRLKKMVADRDLELEVMKEINAKNGERARPKAGGRVRATARTVLPQGVRAAESGEVGVEVSIEAGGQGRARDEPHVGAGGAVPAVRLPAGSNLPRARRTTRWGWRVGRWR